MNINRTQLLTHVRSHPMLTAGLAASAGVLAGGVLMVQVLGTPSPQAKIQPGMVSAPPPVVVAATPASVPAALPAGPVAVQQPASPPQADANAATQTAAVQGSDCDKQTWPYLSQPCIEAARSKSVTRVIAPERNAAVASTAPVAPAVAPVAAAPVPVQPAAPAAVASVATTGTAIDRDIERSSRSERLFATQSDGAVDVRDRETRKRDAGTDKRSRRDQRELARRELDDAKRRAKDFRRQELAVSDSAEADDDDVGGRPLAAPQRRGSRAYADEAPRVERRVIEVRRPSFGPFEALFGGFD